MLDARLSLVTCPYYLHTRSGPGVRLGLQPGQFHQLLGRVKQSNRERECRVATDFSNISMLKWVSCCTRAERCLYILGYCVQTHQDSPHDFAGFLATWQQGRNDHACVWHDSSSSNLFGDGKCQHGYTFPSPDRMWEQIQYLPRYQP